MDTVLLVPLVAEIPTTTRQNDKRRTRTDCSNISDVAIYRKECFVLLLLVHFGDTLSTNRMVFASMR